ncbi:hypothetical protein PSET11_01823 [Arthrobacter ulcerisalmonis]|uniref:Membrane protein insertion efficiency factor n=1 Tax=Arthrobacter ulcerisalmonis TaxID=2483813 RepID=A0A3P5WYH1_9MICC|nr:membrane protein insertion efficiency factor YidD [Arthrobacter ulcerisalmonis]VDC26905.1 hypothetical protein PSET11_01823 [Arthrobacter ulcerisalmonis]
MATYAVHGHGRTQAGQWLDSVMGWAAYAAVKVLIRIAPRPNTEYPQPAGAHRWSRLPVTWFVGAYQRSPLRDRLKSEGRQCVYLPSCTEYAERAVLTYGFWRGLMLTGDRFRRCSEGGHGSYVDFP